MVWGPRTLFAPPGTSGVSLPGHSYALAFALQRCASNRGLVLGVLQAGRGLLWLPELLTGLRGH